MAVIILQQTTPDRLWLKLLAPSNVKKLVSITMKLSSDNNKRKLIVSTSDSPSSSTVSITVDTLLHQPWQLRDDTSNVLISRNDLQKWKNGRIISGWLGDRQMKGITQWMKCAARSMEIDTFSNHNAIDIMVIHVWSIKHNKCGSECDNTMGSKVSQYD